MGVSRSKTPQHSSSLPPSSSFPTNTLLMLPRIGLKAELCVFSCRLRTRNYSVSTSSPKRRKVWDSADEAVKDVKTGDVLLSGGRSLSS